MSVYGKGINAVFDQVVLDLGGAGADIAIAYVNGADNFTNLNEFLKEALVVRSVIVVNVGIHAGDVPPEVKRVVDRIICINDAEIMGKIMAGRGHETCHGQVLTPPHRVKCQ